MKKYVYVQLVVATLFILMSVSNSWAIGLGFYLEGGSGDGDYTIDTDFGDFDDDYTSSHTGIGFTLDTAPASARLFNYRLQVGYETWGIDADDGEDADLTGYTISNDFGFSFLPHNPKVRFWGGGEFRFGGYTGDNDANEDISVTAYGLGPVIGANIMLKQNMYLTLKGGYLFGQFSGTIDTDLGDFDIDGEYNYTFIDAGLLFEL
jgi:hypothetical protein